MDNSLMKIGHKTSLSQICGVLCNHLQLQENDDLVVTKPIPFLPQKKCHALTKSSTYTLVTQFFVFFVFF
jgi:hypothetical protein